jgi:hypothetical protein
MRENSKERSCCCGASSMSASGVSMSARASPAGGRWQSEQFDPVWGWPLACRVRWRVGAKTDVESTLWTRTWETQTNSQFSTVILIVHCPPLVDAAMQHECDDPSRFGSTDAIRGIAMKNHCAYCHGKFGLVRYRRAFKTFCSQTCVDHYRAWLRAEVGKRKSWSDCLWLASLNVVPYAGEKSSV